jgi:hypothetical protein
MLSLWGGGQLVTKYHRQLLFKWYTLFVFLFFNSIPELGYPSATLQQATVGMLPKYLCREEDYFGKYISELNICVKSNDEENLQCVVRK